jgi:hypothetical protein
MRLVLTDADGRLLFCGQTLPGSIHDHLIQLRQAGLVERPARTPALTLLADAGSPSLSALTAGAVLPGRPGGRASCRSCPPSPPRTRPNAGPTPEAPASQRIRVEQGISHRTTWRARRGTSAAASTWPPSCARSPDWSVAGVRRVRLHSDGHRQDHPNAVERLPDWVGWTHP